MKNNIRWEFLFGIGLIVIATVLHFLHYLVFGEVSPLLSFLGKKIAFVPLEVLFITLVFHKLLTMHERGMIKKKMNMLAGSFFSEAGHDLLEILSKSAVMTPAQAELVMVHKDWSKKDFDRAAKTVEQLDIKMDADIQSLTSLKELLCDKRQYLMLVLGNPNLQEHESFSDMLWAIMHLTDELSRRKQIESLPQSDIKHLSNDAKRAYLRLLSQWFQYLSHLKKMYPYLYSYEIRTNPFDPEPNVIIE